MTHFWKQSDRRFLLINKFLRNNNRNSNNVNCPAWYLKRAVCATLCVTQINKSNFQSFRIKLKNCFDRVIRTLDCLIVMINRPEIVFSIRPCIDYKNFDSDLLLKIILIFRLNTWFAPWNFIASRQTQKLDSFFL